jgi:hypothetical protein
VPIVPRTAVSPGTSRSASAAVAASTTIATPTTTTPAEAPRANVDRFDAARAAADTAAPSRGQSRGAAAAFAGLASIAEGASNLVRRLGRGAMVAVIGASLLGGVVAGMSSTSTSTATPMSVTQVRVLQQAKTPELHLEGVTKAVGLSEAELLHAVTSASASTTLTKDVHLPIAGGQLTLPKGTTFSVDVSDRGLQLHASPAVHLSLDWKPDADLKAFSFSFADGQFHVDAAGFGPDALYSKVATDRVNAMLLPLLPAALKVANFDPRTKGHVELLMGTIAGILGGSSTNAASAHATKDTSLLAGLPIDGVALSVELTAPRAMHHDLGKGIALAIAADARLSVSLHTTIVDNAPQLASATVRSFSGDGVRIERNGDALQSLTLHTLTATANAPGSADAYTVHADYDLAVEDGLRGVIALVGAVVGAAHGVSPDASAASAVQRAGDVKIHPVRRLVDEAVQKLSTPLATAIGSLQPAAPGSAALRTPRS